MDIAIPLFDGITALDAIGPYEVLSRLPGARVRFVAETPGPKRTDNKQLTLMADEPLSAVPHPEIVMVPGGFGTRRLMTPNPLLDWIRTAHETSQWTTSVCTGSLLLGAAGLLKGLDATTHWAALDDASDNTAAVGPARGEQYVADWMKRSDVIRRTPGARIDLRYGAGARQRVDVFPCGRSAAPTLVFIHGGYWQLNDKEPYA